MTCLLLTIVETARSVVTVKPQVRPLGALETLVMEQVWQAAPCTARDVHGRLTGEHERAYTTIMTTLDRLFHKGLLGREREGTAWLYTPRQSRANYERSLAGALAERIIDEHGDVGLAAFVDVAASHELVDRLATLVEDRRRNRSVPKGEG